MDNRMRAQFIYENLDFERNQNPKKSIDIGIRKTIEEKIKRLLEHDGKEGIFILSINIYDGDGAEFVVDDMDGGEWGSLVRLIKLFDLDTFFDLENNKEIYNNSGVLSYAIPFYENFQGLFKNVIYLYEPSSGSVKTQPITNR